MKAMVIPENKSLDIYKVPKDIPRLPANVTRNDISEFLSLAAKIPIKPEIQRYRLENANTALQELREGKIRGAKVLEI
jgi:D-arabinose 1-dehydrogenase-like Zn-dependent alcohol dehydrogenase